MRIATIVGSVALPLAIAVGIADRGIARLGIASALNER